GAGSSKLDGDTVGAYATWLSGTGFYMDASYRRMDFDARVRTTSGEIRTSGNADAFNLEAGYAWTLDNGLQIEPQLQYTGVRVDGINQLAGALANFESEGGDSSLARLGVAVRKTFQDGSTAWTPYVTLSTVHEFDGQNGFTINDDFSGHTSVEGTHALVEAGLTVDLGRLSLFGGANWMDGGARESVAGGQLGMRFAW
ncbi:MAG: autotransporter outer membrane beta-barrel domain-containing protein, partial [Pseudoxanthomonas sp.]